MGQVGGAHRLVETFPGAGRGVGLLLHPQQLLDPLAQQGGTSLSLLACKSMTLEVRLWLWLWSTPTFTLFAVEEVVVDVGHQAGHDLRLVSHPVLLRAPLAPPQHACKVKRCIRCIRRTVQSVQSVHSPLESNFLLHGAAMKLYGEGEGELCLKSSGLKRFNESGHTRNIKQRSPTSIFSSWQHFQAGPQSSTVPQFDKSQHHRLGHLS